MAFIPVWTNEAGARYRELEGAARESLKRRKNNKQAKASKAEGLFKQTHKCIELLLANPRHPGLCTHEYSSLENPYNPKEKVFEAYVQNKTPGAYRVFWCYGPERGEITLIAITPHP